MSVTVLHVFAAAVSLRFLRGQAEFMAGRGYVLDVVVSPRARDEPSVADSAVTVTELAIPRRIAPWQDLRAIRRLRQVIAVRKPRIVHAHTPKGGLIGMIAASLVPGVQRIYHMRGLPLETAAGWRRLALTNAERLSCHLAHRVICVSPSLRDRAIELGLVSHEKAIVLAHGSGNGVDGAGVFAPASGDDERRAATRATWGAGAATPIVAFVGRLARDKGLRELTAAWALVCERLPDAKLIIAGPVDEREAADAHVLEELRRDTSVYLLGAVSDVRSIYLGCDIVVLPTYREGFPNVLIEAAAMERPVVATNVTGCRDAVVDGLTGTLVPAHNAEELARALIAYAEDPARRRRAGKEARRRALALFQPMQIWSALADQYDALMR
jgi:glycosyltransferase involved in cell wall biosynthesis